MSLQQQSIYHDKSPMLSKNYNEIQYQSVTPLSKQPLLHNKPNLHQTSITKKTIEEPFSSSHETKTQDYRKPVRENPKIDSKRSDSEFQTSGFLTSPRGMHYEEGKAFFKEARRILQFEKFNELIQNIKLLNKGQKSKEEIIKIAEEIFGKDNERMLDMFKKLIYRAKNK